MPLELSRNPGRKGIRTRNKWWCSLGQRKGALPTVLSLPSGAVGSCGDISEDPRCREGDPYSDCQRRRERWENVGPGLSCDYGGDYKPWFHWRGYKMHLERYKLQANVPPLFKLQSVAIFEDIIRNGRMEIVASPSVRYPSVFTSSAKSRFEVMISTLSVGQRGSTGHFCGNLFWSGWSVQEVDLSDLPCLHL